MMRSLYKGIIGFGLVSIPIQLFKAMDEERVETHWIHKACGSRIRYQKQCSACQSPVAPGDIVKGAPLPDGRYVELPEPHDTPHSDRTITIVSFHALRDIDPVFFQKAYWLKASLGGEKAYHLLSETIAETGRVALAEMRLRQKVTLAVVRTYGEGTLMLHTMYFPESLRREGEAFGHLEVNVTDKERKMAMALIEQMDEPFVAANFPNVERQKLLEQIQALIPSVRATPDSATTGQVASLMEQLKASMAQNEKKKKKTSS